ncbi:MAG: LysM peptidoglycan-binding domain-containing protein [Bacteroidota bacterium]
MIKNCFLLLTLIQLFLFYPVLSQTPLVPDKIQFANLDLKLTEGLRKEIQKDVNDLTASKKYFQIKVNRVDQFISIVERVLREENVPDDFKYLAIQESAYISDAVSSSNAIGFWQFKIPAAKEVGLRVDRHVDERKNIVASTRGAAKYLKKNNFYFNNWLYALLAYQTGPTGAEKYAEEKYFGKQQMTLKKNTYWYVKKFLAHKIAFQNALKKNSNPEIVLSEYTRGKNKSLKAIAKETSTDLELLKDYNKWLKRGSVPSDKDYIVIVPLTNGNKKEYLAAIQESKKAEISTGRVSQPEIRGTLRAPTVTIIKVNGIDALIAGSDDNLESLAERGNTTKERLVNYNDMSFNDAIKAGEVYYLKPKKGKAKIHYHTFLSGENLWAISQRYGIKLNKLIQKNRISLTDELKPGRVLWLKKRRPSKTPIEYKKLVVGEPKIEVAVPKKKPLVKEEDEADQKKTDSTPVKSEQPIQNAKVDDIPVDSLATENTTSDIDSVFVKNKGPNDKEIVQEKSDSIEIKEDVKNIAEVMETLPAQKDSLHVVEKGQTLYAISRLYDVSVKDILQANGMDQSIQLAIGQELLIPEMSKNIEETTNSKTHTVKAGDTLYKIAKQYGVSVEDILKWNNKTDYTLKVEEKLVIENSETLN